MMAQEMYEKSVQLEKEVDACRHLIQRWIPHMTSQMHDVDKMREEFEDLINGLPSSVVEDDDDEETFGKVKTEEGWE